MSFLDGFKKIYISPCLPVCIIFFRIVEYLAYLRPFFIRFFNFVDIMLKIYLGSMPAPRWMLTVSRPSKEFLWLPMDDLAFSQFSSILLGRQLILLKAKLCIDMIALCKNRPVIIESYHLQGPWFSKLILLKIAENLNIFMAKCRRKTYFML